MKSKPTEAARLLAKYEKNASLDGPGKQIFSNVNVRAALLVEMSPPFQGLSVDYVAECIVRSQGLKIPENVQELLNYRVEGLNRESSAEEDATIVFDIVFRVDFVDIHGNKQSLIIDLEIQQSSSPGYKLYIRADYYVSRLLSDEKGWIFFKSNYNDLEPVWSIWVVSDRVGKPKREIIEQKTTIFEEEEDEEEEEENDFVSFQNIVITKLGNPKYKTKSRAINLLRALLYPDYSLDERKEILEKFGIRTSEIEEELSEMETMWSTFAEEQQKIGEVKGEAKGSDRTAEAFKMLANGKTAADVAASLKIPYATVQEYASIGEMFRDR